MNSYKGVFVFLLLFACVAIVTTVCLAKKSFEGKDNNINQTIAGDVSADKKTETPNDAEDKKKYVIEDINGYYFTNNIEFKEQKHQEGKNIEYGYTIFDEKELDITYFTIDGLKNEEVERKINEEIRQAAFEENTEKDNKCIGKVVKYNISGNYANILSFTISTMWYYPRESEHEDWKSDYESKYFNYNLVNGEQIELEDLFTSMQPIRNQINIAAEEQYLWDEPVTEGDSYTPQYIEYVNRELDKNYEEWTLRFGKKSEEIEKAAAEGKIMDEASWKKWYYRSAREEKKIKIMQNFEKGNYNFSISDRYIAVDVGDVSAKVYLLPNIDVLTLYKRYFADESIFTDEYNNSSKQQYKFYQTDSFKYGFIEDNIIIYAEADFSGNLLEEDEYSIASKIMNEKLNAMQEYLKYDEENVYLINSIASGYISTFYMIKIPKEEFTSHHNYILNLFSNLDLRYDYLVEDFYNFEDFKNHGFEYVTYSDNMNIFLRI